MPDLVRTAFFDVQDAGGLHFWAGVDEWHTPDGRSRRVDYQRLETWDSCRSFQQDHKVEDRNTGIDLGHRYRETLARCVQYHWIGYKGSDQDNFVHHVKAPGAKSGDPLMQVFRPWSTRRFEDALAGKSLVNRNATRAITYLWSNPYFYPILYLLKKGEGRYYGIPIDICKEYIEQINAMIPRLEAGKLIWENHGRNKANHAWDVACGNLVMAVQRGYFLVEEEKPSKEQAK